MLHFSKKSIKQITQPYTSSTLTNNISFKEIHNLKMHLCAIALQIINILKAQQSLN